MKKERDLFIRCYSLKIKKLDDEMAALVRYEHPKDFFLFLECSLQLCVNPNTMFRYLHQRGLLNDKDVAKISQESSDYGRIRLVCEILSKNPSSPWVFLNIVIHEGVHVGEGHAVLREMLESYLYLFQVKSQVILRVNK